MAGTISATTASLIAAAVGLAGTGVGAYEAQDSAANQAAAQKQQQQAQTNQANLTKQEAVLGQQGNAQQQTSGSLTDPGTAALTDLLAGYPGFQGGANGGTGGSAGTGTAAAAGAVQPNIAALLAALQNKGSGNSGLFNNGSSSISGGNWPASTPQPSQQFELSNSVIG